MLRKVKIKVNKIKKRYIKTKGIEVDYYTVKATSLANQKHHPNRDHKVVTA